MEAEFLQWIAGILGTVLTGVLLYGARYLASKTSSELFKQAVTRVSWACRTAYAEVQQTYVEAIKEASMDGKLTEDERRTAMGKALGVARSLIGMRGLRIVAKACGIANGGMDAFLVSNLEAAVAELPKHGALLTVGPRIVGTNAQPFDPSPGSTPD